VIDKELVERLRASKLKIGPIYPVLVDKEGEVIDGEHRLAADPNWPKWKLTWVDTEELRLAIREQVNSLRRVVSFQERKKELTKLAELIKEKAPDKATVVSEVAKATGFTERYVRRALPDEYKMVSKKRLAELVPQTPIHCPVCRTKLSKERVKEIHEWVRDDPELYTVIRKYPGFEGGK